MILKDYLKPITKSVDDSKLSDFQNRIDSIDNQIYGVYSTIKTLVDDEKTKYIKDTEIKINEILKIINRDFRKDVLKVSPDYKREGISVWSLGDKTLTAIIGNEFNFNFNVKSYKDRTRISYSKEKLLSSMVIALSFLFSKYSEVYDFQIKYTFIKVLIDFFDFRSIDYLEAYQVYTQILNIDMSVIVSNIKELGIQPKTKVTKRERKPKTELPTKEQFEYWISSGQYTMTRIKKSIAQQYHVSERTVHRKLVEYGLVRKYTFK